MSAQIYSFLDQTGEGRKPFFWRVQEGGATLSEYPEKHLVVIKDETNFSFCEI